MYSWTDTYVSSPAGHGHHTEVRGVPEGASTPLSASYFLSLKTDCEPLVLRLTKTIKIPVENISMPSTERSCTWSLTINNPNDGDEELINLARQKGWKVEGQKEVGKEGTIHYQLMVKTPQTRFSTIKKAFPRAHIEIARNVAALEQYVHKEETRVGELVSQSDMYPSLNKLWDLIYEYCISTNVNFNRIRVRGECPLDTFDYAIRFLILQGYNVESLASNPSTRSCWKNYGYELMKRSADRQTDRQQEKLSRRDSITTNAYEESISSQTVSVRTLQEERDEALQGSLPTSLSSPYSD